jgi:hypothetical protein
VQDNRTTLCITDVIEFKATMMLGAVPQPIKDITEFEDIEGNDDKGDEGDGRGVSDRVRAKGGRVGDDNGPLE